MTLALTGHGVADGIAIGRVHVAERSEAEISEYRIDEHEAEKEIARYRQANAQARAQLKSLAISSDQHEKKSDADLSTP